MDSLEALLPKTAVARYRRGSVWTKFPSPPRSNNSDSDDEFDEERIEYLKTKINTITERAYSPEDSSTAVSPWVASLSDSDAFSYFFNTIATFINVGDPSMKIAGWLTTLPSLVNGASSGSHLPSAIQALCLANTGITLRAREFIARGRKAYGQSLVLINRALQDPNASIRDDTIVSILLLGFFEVRGSGNSLSFL